MSRNLIRKNQDAILVTFLNKICSQKNITSCSTLFIRIYFFFFFQEERKESTWKHCSGIASWMGPQLPLKRNPSRRINVQGQLRNASFFGDDFQTTQNDHHVTFLILNQEKDKDVTTRCPDKFSKISQFSRIFFFWFLDTLKNILKILKNLLDFWTP